MRNYIYSTLLFLLTGTSIFGQSPSWSVNENDFQYTMTFVGFVNVDGITLTSLNDKVGAFVNGECRGVTNLVYVASENKYFAYLTIFSNMNNEAVNFKIYDSKNKSIKDVVKTIPFGINNHFGNLFQAYSFASPALKSDAKILNFGFFGITNNDIETSGSQITISLNKGLDLSSLKSIFELSSGANLYIGTVKQISDTNSLDFTNPIQF